MSILPPNLFLIGAPKAGTSSLANALQMHSEICCPKKEPRFFDACVYYTDMNFHPIQTRKEYLSLFDSPACQQSKYRLDASVFTMYSIRAIKSIRRMTPDARFIIVLRDPLTASKSMFMQRLKHARREMREVSEDFSECWNLLEKRSRGFGLPDGCKSPILFQYDRLFHYERYVPSILEEVGKQNLIVIRYEKYKESPEETLAQLCEFLELEFNASHMRVGIVNPTVAISSGIWNRLIEFIIRRTKRLRTLIGMTNFETVRASKLVDKLRLKKKIEISSDCDDRIIREFHGTYEFLRKLENCEYVKRIW